MTNYPYPYRPETNTENIVKLSPAYRQNVIKVLFSIILFIAFYLAVLAGGLAMLWYAGKLSLVIVSARIHWITILAAAGIMMMAVMFFVFLVKFMFKIQKDENPSRIEIKEIDQPLLFDFIRRVCKETRAPFPKKIFLSPDVNACVFYNSSFLSMFFPVRKNLEIGLGLVNSLNISEFKAVLAHEFGHFSQSSTRLGSYVYRLNKMIYNLLYDNSGWSDTLESISSIHYILSFFGRITVGLVNLAIKGFLVAYKMVNAGYMSLSREMEFHADLVAVSVSGSKSIISALYRIEFSQSAYSYTLQHAQEYFEKEKKVAPNFFDLHRRSIRYLGEYNKATFESDLPVVNQEFFEKLSLPVRVKYKDAYATHPDTPEREANAYSNHIVCEEIIQSAWCIFTDREKLQQKISEKLYEISFQAKKPQKTDLATLEKHFSNIEKRNNYNPVYNDFYTYTAQTYAEPELNPQFISELNNISPSDLFTHEITNMSKHYQRVSQEIQILENIKSGDIPVKKFEFEKITYKFHDAERIISTLKPEQQKLGEQLELQKKKINTWFYLRLKGEDADNYKNLLKLRFMMGSDYQKLLDLFGKLMEFYHTIQNYSEDELNYSVKRLTQLTDELKQFMANVPDDVIHISCLDETLKNKSYKEILLQTKIRTRIANIHSIVPLLEDLGKTFDNILATDDILFRNCLDLQDKILEEKSAQNTMIN